MLTREQGKPLSESYAEVARTAARLRYFADLAPRTRRIDDGRPVHSEIRWRPLGPVAAIVPWNFPFSSRRRSSRPRSRPATPWSSNRPRTPLATRLLGAVLATALPEDVLTVVTGREPLGARLASHPGIRHVTFTGSVPTGRAVAGAAAVSLARVTLELGGNDAAVLLDDVDVDRIADRLFWAAFRNCGQVCMAVKRVYAPPGSTPRSSRPSHTARRPSSSDPAWTRAPGSGRSTTSISWPGSSGSRNAPWRPVPGRRPAVTGSTDQATSTLPRSSRMSLPTTRW